MLRAVLHDPAKDGLDIGNLALELRWRAPQGVDAANRAVRRIAIDEVDFSRWAEGVRGRGATINDGLLAEAIGIAGMLSNGRHGAAFYTINLRRYLRERRPVVGNLSGFLAVRTGRRGIADRALRLDTVHNRTSAHKAGIPGLGSNLLPILLFGWLPHGLLRMVARGLRKGFLMLGRRALVMTNVGTIDDYLAPIEPLLDDAWMTSPSFPGFPSPISLVSSFRGRVNVAVGRGDGRLPSSVVADAWHRRLSHPTVISQHVAEPAHGQSGGADSPATTPSISGDPSSAERRKRDA